MRSFLSDNKIYFETIAAAALTFMGIMVGIKSCEISNNQLKVAQRELEIQEKEKAPILRYNYWFGSYLPGDENYYRNEEDMPWNNKSLTLYNDGAKISLISVDVTEIIKITKQNSNEVIDIGRKERHWSYFKLAEHFTGEGYLGEITGKQDNHDASKRTYLRLENNIIKMDFDLIDIFKIDFTNSIGEKQTEYYSISSNSGTQKLGRAEAEALFEKYHDHKRVLTIEDTPKEIVDSWAQKVQ